MKCERCGQEDAVVKITRIEPGGHAHQLLLCQECAAEASPYQKKLKEKQANFEMLFKELLKAQKVEIAEDEEAQKPDVPPCPACGLEFARYRATYMLGCPDCYEAFGDALEADLERIHRATRHIGTAAPARSKAAELQERLQAMRSELTSAVEYEDYERAAFLRDEIARTEKALRESVESSSQENPAKGGKAT